MFLSQKDISVCVMCVCEYGNHIAMYIILYIISVCNFGWQMYFSKARGEERNSH